MFVCVFVCKLFVRRPIRGDPGGPPGHQHLGGANDEDAANGDFCADLGRQKEDFERNRAKDRCLFPSSLLFVFSLSRASLTSGGEPEKAPKERIVEAERRVPAMTSRGFRGRRGSRPPRTGRFADKPFEDRGRGRSVFVTPGRERPTPAKEDYSRSSRDNSYFDRNLSNGSRRARRGLRCDVTLALVVVW